MRLGLVLSELGTQHDLPVSRERDQREHLIEVSVVDGDRAAARLAALVFRKLRPVDLELARALHGSVAEIGANAPEHSGTIGFMAAQTLPRRNELLLAVGDAGVGIRATLAHRGAENDERAIELATRERVSRSTNRTAARACRPRSGSSPAQRGSLYLATGTASIRHFGSTRRYLAAASPYPGTIVRSAHTVVVTGDTIMGEEDVMAVLILPYLAAGRDLAAAWVRLLGPIDGGRVVVNANPMVNASPSFARQLVRSALVTRNAAEFVVVGGSGEFANEVKLAADELGVCRSGAVRRGRPGTRSGGRDDHRRSRPRADRKACPITRFSSVKAPSSAGALPWPTPRRISRASCSHRASDVTTAASSTRDPEISSRPPANATARRCTSVPT